jgi:hypothetical protein
VPNTTVSPQPRRFSEGMELVPTPPSTVRVGRFSDGTVPSVPVTPDQVGSFADGFSARPRVLHVGSFAHTAPATPRRRPARRPRRRLAPAHA